VGRQEYIQGVIPGPAADLIFAGEFTGIPEHPIFVCPVAPLVVRIAGILATIQGLNTARGDPHKLSVVKLWTL